MSTTARPVPSHSGVAAPWHRRVRSQAGVEMRTVGLRAAPHLVHAEGQGTGLEVTATLDEVTRPDVVLVPGGPGQARLMDHEPLLTSSNHLFGFLRAGRVAVLVSRLMASAPDLGAATVALPAGRWTNVLAGRAAIGSDGSPVPAGDVLDALETATDRAEDVANIIEGIVLEHG